MQQNAHSRMWSVPNILIVTMFLSYILVTYLLSTYLIFLVNYWFISETMPKCKYRANTIGIWREAEAM